MFTLALTGAKKICLLLLLLDLQEIFTSAITGDTLVVTCWYGNYRGYLFLLLLDLHEMFAHAITGGTGDANSCYTGVASAPTMVPGQPGGTTRPT